MAGKFLGKIPFAGDVLNAVVTGTLGKHAGTPRAIPAAVMTGVAGAGASAATMGADVIPALMDLGMSIYGKAKGGNLSPGERALARGSAMTNPDRYIEAAVNQLLEEKRFNEVQKLLKATRGMTSVPPSF